MRCNVEFGISLKFKQTVAQNFCSYLLVNTIRPHYKDQLLNSAYTNNHCLFCDRSKCLKETACGFDAEFGYVTGGKSNRKNAL